MPARERRTQLLDAALEIVAEGGFPAASMESIARVAGVTRPVVYGSYANLGLLLAALLRREQRRALRQLAEIVPAAPGGRDPDAVLVEGMGAFLDAVAAQPLTWRLILLPVEGTPALLRRQVDRRRAALLEEVRTLVHWGLAARGGPSDLDEELLARAILALGEEAGRLLLTDPDRFSRARLTDYTATLLAALGRSA